MVAFTTNRVLSVSCSLRALPGQSDSVQGGFSTLRDRGNSDTTDKRSGWQDGLPLFFGDPPALTGKQYCSYMGMDARGRNLTRQGKICPQPSFHCPGYDSTPGRPAQYGRNTKSLRQPITATNMQKRRPERLALSLAYQLSRSDTDGSNSPVLGTGLPRFPSLEGRLK